MIISFDKVPYFKSNKNLSKQRFTIIIPFRNEVKNIPVLAASLQKLAYPNSQFEVFWINDDSTDDSVSILTEFLHKNAHWNLINNERKTGSPKKDAINIAVLKAKYEWIITTDADCIVPQNWLQTFGSFIDFNKEKTHMIAGAVAYKTNHSFLHHFQQLDFLSLIGTTIGSFGIGKPFMCNGANLCYRKTTFFEVNGFEGNDTFASGDDVFLLEKMSTKYPMGIRYLKTSEALVVTKPMNDFKSLVNQRIRWASKISATSSWFGKVTGVLVLLMNLFVVGILVFSRNYFATLNEETHTIIKKLGVVLLVKFVIDFILIYKTHRFVGLKKGLIYYIPSFFIYPIFVIYIVVLSMFRKVVWKGRTF